MEHPVDLDRWPRRAHYEFFREYEHPAFNVTADVDVTALEALRARDPSARFFATTLGLALGALNALEPFRLRLREHGVIEHSVIHGGSTVLREDGTFGFGYYEHAESLRDFVSATVAELKRVSSARDLDPNHDRDDLVYFTALPWIAFSSFQHARARGGREDSIPRVVFGKRQERDGRQVMPVSVEVHHALVDGLHLGQFYETFQQRIDRVGELWV